MRQIDLKRQAKLNFHVLHFLQENFPIDFPHCQETFGKWITMELKRNSSFVALKKKNQWDTVAVAFSHHFRSVDERKSWSVALKMVEQFTHKHEADVLFWICGFCSVDSLRMACSIWTLLFQILLVFLGCSLGSLVVLRKCLLSAGVSGALLPHSVYAMRHSTPAAALMSETCSLEKFLVAVNLLRLCPVWNLCAVRHPHSVWVSRCDFCLEDRSCTAKSIGTCAAPWAYL